MKNENIFLQRISERQSQRIQEEISKFLLEDFISIHSLPIASIARTVQDKITELLKLYAKTWRVALEKEEEEYNSDEVETSLRIDLRMDLMSSLNRFIGSS